MIAYLLEPVTYGIVEGLVPDDRPRAHGVGAGTDGPHLVVTGHKVKESLHGRRGKVHVSVRGQDERVVIGGCRK